MRDLYRGGEPRQRGDLPARSARADDGPRRSTAGRRRARSMAMVDAARASSCARSRPKPAAVRFSANDVSAGARAGDSRLARLLPDRLRVAASRRREVPQGHGAREAAPRHGLRAHRLLGVQARREHRHARRPRRRPSRRPCRPRSTGSPIRCGRTPTSRPKAGGVRSCRARPRRRRRRCSAPRRSASRAVESWASRSAGANSAAPTRSWSVPSFAPPELRRGKPGRPRRSCPDDCSIAAASR